MGLIHGEIELSNPRRPTRRLRVKVLADSGALHLCIPEHVRVQLDLEEIDSKEIVLADGHRERVPYVGPVEIRFKNRVGFSGALVLGDEVLLGAIPMEDLDIVIHPRTRQLDVNPDNPNMGVSPVKLLV